MTILNPVNKSYWLANLCEANYRKLIALIPELTSLPATAALMAEGRPALHLRLIERCPYTMTVELTHSFNWGFEASLEPAVQIRIYLDAGVAEVLSDHERPFVLDALRDRISLKGVLDYKWSLNYFLSQWLDHCLQSSYSFSLASPDEECRAPATC
ncbi:DUF1249 domain-containing protein [Methyloterricola oryzae]|uniref:DUF1249 domain-containing protein n=1 Tax=Methyloterricola oryzae TaxID=1495050 RepID=UPI0005EB78C9|nr:DUF1249 domain-containing protein [Methyloterricola oryzae]